MTKKIYLKVDVDTYLGMKRGVPCLLDLLGEFDIKATFFLSFGPDHSGRALFNIWRKKGFLKKMIRTRAPALYGFRTMLYGTLLPGPRIAANFPDMVRRLEAEGHEVGVHAWDHRLWQDHLDTMPEARIRAEFEKSFASYRNILGHDPASTAAPAWYCNRASLAIQDTLDLAYCSDTRGQTPFLPILEEQEFETPQIPTTMTCLEELMAAEGVLRLTDYLSGELRDDEPNVFPLHAEVEGNTHCGLFRTTVQQTLMKGATYHPLIDLCLDRRESPIVRHRILYATLPGRSGKVAAQEVQEHR